MAVAVVPFVAFVVSFRLPLGDRADVWVGDPLGCELLRGPTRFIARMLATLRVAQSDVIRVTTHVRAYLAWYARYLDSENASTKIPHAPQNLGRLLPGWSH